MKKVAILLLVIIAASSCSLFEKPSMTQEEINALVKQKATVEEELANVTEDRDMWKLKAEECTQLLEEQTSKPKMVSGNYYVIAGSFKNSQYATEYSEKIRQMGGTGTIVPGPYNFNLVAFSVHETLSAAAESMYSVRTSVSADAWIWKQK